MHLSNDVYIGQIQKIPRKHVAVAWHGRDPGHQKRQIIEREDSQESPHVELAKGESTGGDASFGLFPGPQQDAGDEESAQDEKRINPGAAKGKPLNLLKMFQQDSPDGQRGCRRVEPCNPNVLFSRPCRFLQKFQASGNARTILWHPAGWSANIADPKRQWHTTRGAGGVFCRTAFWLALPVSMFYRLVGGYARALSSSRRMSI